MDLPVLMGTSSLPGHVPVNRKDNSSSRLRTQANPLDSIPSYNRIGMAGTRSKASVVEAICPDCGATLRIDTQTGAIVSHTPAPRKRTFEDLETAAKAMREQDDRKESIFRQSLEAEKNKEDLLEKRFAEALRKAKDAPAGKPLREFDLD